MCACVGAFGGQQRMHAYIHIYVHTYNRKSVVPLVWGSLRSGSPQSEQKITGGHWPFSVHFSKMANKQDTFKWPIQMTKWPTNLESLFFLLCCTACRSTCMYVHKCMHLIFDINIRTYISPKATSHSNKSPTGSLPDVLQ